MVSKICTVSWGLLAMALPLLTGCGVGDGADGIIGTGTNEPISNGSPPTKAPIKLVGAAQKGPYLKGSQVLLSRLLADGTPSPETTRTEIEDDLGNFRYSVTQTGPILISADGYHFNELTGKLSQNRLQLNAVYNVTGAIEQRSYVNVLTHLAYKRALKLIRDGKAVNEAIHQSESEVLAAYNPVLPAANISDFTQLNLFNLNAAKADGNAYALALSATIYEYATLQAKTDPDVQIDSQLAGLLNGLADDLSDDGAISRSDVINGLKAAARLLRPDDIQKNLENRGFVTTKEKLPVANMNLYLDTDGDGIVNSDDDDDDNDGLPDTTDSSPYVYSEAPKLIAPDMDSILTTGQEIILEWSVSDYAKQIEVQYSKDSTFSHNVTTSIFDTNHGTKTFASAGAYYLRSRSKNGFDVWGTWSMPAAVNVAVWTKHFGGTGEEASRQIIASRTGGVIVRGITKSREISENVDSNYGDDWIFKVNDKGDIVWQYQLTSPDYPILRDMIELSDGSIISVGGGFKSGNGEMLKLDADGTLVWKSSYRPSNTTASYAFQSIAETDGTLYIIGGNAGNLYPAYSLHRLNAMNGEVTDATPVIEPKGMRLGISKLRVSAAGDLLVAGPVYSFEEYYDNLGVVLLHLAPDGTSTTVWSSVGQRSYSCVGDVVNLPSGRISVIGQWWLSGRPSITTLNTDGSEYASLTTGLESGIFYFCESTLSAGTNDRLYGLFLDDHAYASRPLSFVAFDSKLRVQEQTFLPEFGQIVEIGGLVENTDGTFTFLFSDTSNNRDIVIVRRDRN